ncbi:MAG: hypothetical protein QG633_368 [Patescibacteria group bacterium]|jgi:hypothetical protein|nr:hypothetical protein [Patescibacteria group bacterium]
MKKVSRVVALVLLLAMAPIAASATEGFSMALTDSSGEKVIELKRFFAQFDWRSDGSGDTIRRVRPLLYLGHGTCRGKVEMNLAATEVANDANGNWLEIATLECAVSANTTVSVGRLFLSGPRSTPPPFLLRTVEYPKSNTFAAYAYGVQLQRTFGEWNFVVDVTGDSGRQFNDDGNFDRIESSFRIGRKLGSVGTLSFTSQLSRDFTRVGLDWMSSSDQKLNVWAGVYYDDGTTEKLLGMAQVSYPLGRYIRPHVMWDHRPDGSEEWTVGTEVFVTPHVRVLGDYETRADRILARLQFHW